MKSNSGDLTFIFLHDKLSIKSSTCFISPNLYFISILKYNGLKRLGIKLPACIHTTSAAS